MDHASASTGEYFLALVKHWFETLAQCGRIDAKDVLRFIEGFRDGDGVFRSLIDCLVGRSLLEPLLSLLPLLNSEKHWHWRAWTEDAAVRVAALEGVDLRTRIDLSPSATSPLLSCWMTFKGMGNVPSCKASASSGRFLCAIATNTGRISTWRNSFTASSSARWLCADLLRKIFPLSCRELTKLRSAG